MELLNKHDDITIQTHNILKTLAAGNAQDEMERGLEIALYRMLDGSSSPRHTEHAEVAAARERLEITAKLFLGPNAKPEDVDSAIQKSLFELNTDVVDLFIISVPVIDQATFPLIWQKLEENVRSGYIKRLGVSEFTIPDLQALLSYAQIKPSVNQVTATCCGSEVQEILRFTKSNSIELYSQPQSDSGLSIARLNANSILERRFNEALTAKFEIDWALRYSIMYNERIILATQGYLYHMKKN